MDDRQIGERYAAARRIATEAGALALDYFSRFESLKIEIKGPQDFVTKADKMVEAFVRKAICDAFPEDEIVGEEDACRPGTSGFTWVIDPIDGTTNFIHGIPGWVVVLAGVAGEQTEIGVIHDPVHGELFHCRRGGGAFSNDRPIGVLRGRDLQRGSVGIGFSGRTRLGGIGRLVNAIVAEGGIFYRNGSGALSLTYVATGKLLGYIEEQMNAWDCMAGQLLVSEAGGKVEAQEAARMIAEGGRVIVGAPEVFADLVRIGNAVFTGD